MLLALRPGFRLKARSPSIEPPGAGDDTSLGKQSSSCRASGSVPDATAPPHRTRPRPGRNPACFVFSETLKPSGSR